MYASEDIEALVVSFTLLRADLMTVRGKQKEWFYKTFSLVARSFELSGRMLELSSESPDLSRDFISQRADRQFGIVASQLSQEPRPEFAIPFICLVIEYMDHHKWPIDENERPINKQNKHDEQVSNFLIQARRQWTSAYLSKAREWCSHPVDAKLQNLYMIQTSDSQDKFQEKLLELCDKFKDLCQLSAPSGTFLTEISSKLATLRRVIDTRVMDMLLSDSDKKTKGWVEKQRPEDVVNISLQFCHRLFDTNGDRGVIETNIGHWQHTSSSAKLLRHVKVGENSHSLNNLFSFLIHLISDNQQEHIDRLGRVLIKVAAVMTHKSQNYRSREQNDMIHIAMKEMEYIQKPEKDLLAGVPNVNKVEHLDRHALLALMGLEGHVCYNLLMASSKDEKFNLFEFLHSSSEKVLHNSIESIRQEVCSEIMNEIRKSLEGLKPEHKITALREMSANFLYVWRGADPKNCVSHHLKSKLLVELESLISRG